MTSVKIYVNKQLDGYTFSISPSTRKALRDEFPGSHPANNIFVAFDTKSDFEIYYGKLENHIFPLLLGLDDKEDLKRIKEIIFIEPVAGEILHTIRPSEQKV